MLISSVIFVLSAETGKNINNFDECDLQELDLLKTPERFEVTLTIITFALVRLDRIELKPADPPNSFTLV